MRRIESPTELASIALALVGDLCDLSAAEQDFVRDVHPLRAHKPLEAIRRKIQVGADPLGSAFTFIRSPRVRRKDGATYTPPEIVASMLAWAAKRKTPNRVVDPGAGSGRFLLAAGEHFPGAELVAIEIDPLAALVLRANLAVKGLKKRARVYVSDYRAVRLPDIAGPTLFIGNPPYVRHHSISEEWKTWFAESASERGIKASKLAGLHVHFFFKTLELAKSGDYGAFITSAEWIDVNYGSALRDLLADGLGGEAIHVLDPKSLPFADAATTGVITCFHVNRRPKALRVNAVDCVAELNGLSAGKKIPWAEVMREKRWTTLVRPTPRPATGFVELGEFCRVHRGQVTGSNTVWIAGDHARDIPKQFLRPAVTKAREIFEAGQLLQDPSKLRRVIDLPSDLDTVPMGYRAAIEQFLEWARLMGADQSYIAQHRPAWWSVRLSEPAPILCTYMARRPPAFLRNLCEARHINIAHGLYPREKLSESILMRLVSWLNKNVRQENGRTYAGGLVKFEPKELERVHIPMPENLPA